MGDEVANDYAAMLGRTLKVLRADLGLDRKDLADRAGISYSHLAAIENGQKRPSQQVLVAIAEALGLRSHELLESVEQRRDRYRGASGDPWWLAGDSRVRPATAPAVVAPARAASAREPSTADLAAFVREITDLAARLGPREREAIVHLARTLSSPG